MFPQDVPACWLTDPRVEDETCVCCNHPHSRWKHPSQSGSPVAAQPPCELLPTQSEQPVRGPLSCGMSDRITQNSQSIPKAGPCWECTLLSKACLLESLIFHPAFSLFLSPPPLSVSFPTGCFSALLAGMYSSGERLCDCFASLACPARYLPLFLGRPPGKLRPFQ